MLVVPLLISILFLSAFPVPSLEHVDHGSQHQFTKEDLHKLIIKASNDLEELDKKRREEFKQYEMEKEFQYQESLKNMTTDQKTDAVKRHDEQVKKHREHPRVHHPGSKAVSGHCPIIQLSNCPTV